MEEAQSFESTNINSLWLNNIFENLKNLEMMERNAREGCQGIMEYLMIPHEQRRAIISDTQYKNLRMMISEIHLLLTDLSPVIDDTKLKEFNSRLELVKESTKERKNFIKETYSLNKTLVSSSLSELFEPSLEYVSELKREIIKEISHLLYIKEEKNNKKKW